MLARYGPWHALVDVGAEAVERDGDPHPAVGGVAIVVAEQHDLVVVKEPVVRDGHVRGADRHVQEPVLASGQGVVVDPHLGARHQPDGVAVHASGRLHRAARDDHLPRGLRPALVDVQPVDDHVVHMEEHDACAAGDVHVGPASVDGRNALDEERLRQPDVHAPLEGDPDLPGQHRPAVAQGARTWAHRVVAGVGDHVRNHPGSSVLPHLPCEAHRADGEPLPVGGPVGLLTPAPVDDVCAMDVRRCAVEDKKQSEEKEFFGRHSIDLSTSMLDALCLIEKIRRQGGRETYKLFARHFEVGVSRNIPGSRRDIVELFNLLQLFV